MAKILDVALPEKLVHMAAWLSTTFTTSCTTMIVRSFSYHVIRPRRLIYATAIAYRINAAVDAPYADSLKPVAIPSSTISFFQSLRSALPWPSSNASATTASTTIGLNDPSRPTVTKLPSTIEMETHDFTREEIAEKRMFLLNDNGQCDYYLSSGGGPLEIQYLNMLGAHSSYWTLQDFVRFLVVEVGKAPGRRETLGAIRAHKSKTYKKGAL